MTPGDCCPPRRGTRSWRSVREAPRSAPVNDRPARTPPTVIRDPTGALQSLTPARIGLGRVGHALPTRALLAGDAAHGRARSAVHAALDVAGLVRQLADVAPGRIIAAVDSAATDRATYLLRPDLGRRLSAAGRAEIAGLAPEAGCDLALVIADGLSTTGVHRHAAPTVAAILAAAPADWRLGPLVVARQARVALGDEIGAAFGAEFVALLVGERPGLTCQDSLGIYLTRQPRPGRADAERNCLSNIHPGGLEPVEAARRLWWLLHEARRLGTTGVALKDRSGATAAALRGPAAGEWNHTKKSRRPELADQDNMV